jgi:hypothetical protein
MEPALEHGDERVIDGRLVAVAEGGNNCFGTSAILGDTEAPLALLMEIRGKVDGVM